MYNLYRPVLILFALSSVLSSAHIALADTEASTSVPDLNGTYDVATLTPLERPRAFGNKLYLSRDEAEKIRLADAILSTTVRRTNARPIVTSIAQPRAHQRPTTPSVPSDRTLPPAAPPRRTPWP